MKIINYIKNSLIDYPGKIAAVLFTNGCNWNCWYCQNKKILTDTEDYTREFFDYLRTRKGWIDGVVVCGGEPTIHADLPELCSAIKSLGYSVKLDTNGTNPEMIKELVERQLVDYVAMDIKAPPTKLKEMVDSNNALNKVAESIELLKTCGVDYEFRSTITPDLTLNDIIVMAGMIRGAKRYFLQNYHKPNNSENEPEPHEIEMLNLMQKEAEKIVPTFVR